MSKRIQRLNSLLKEVISEVVTKNVKNPHISALVTITEVSITKDLHFAKVYVSVIGSVAERKKTLQALQSASGFISRVASKKVIMRYFPSLTFCLDTTVDKQMEIESLLKKINEERKSRTL